MKPDGAWFQAQFSLSDLKVIKTSEPDLSNSLNRILLKVRELNNKFLVQEEGVETETILEFEPEFGFGSSSTLINNLARWAEVDPYKLQRLTFGGSGYDVACAQADQPITFQLQNGSHEIKSVFFNPLFREHIYFVYLNKKQRSVESIADFRKSALFSKQDVLSVGEITDKLLLADGLADFEELLFEHEKLLATVLKRPTIKSEVFIDHQGIVKSLGGWGGDFVLMTTHMDQPDFESYLIGKGFETFYKFDEIIKT